jgi:UrcA family protein
MIASATNASRSFVGAAATLLFAGLCIAGAPAQAAAHTSLSVNGDGQRVAIVSHADLDLGSKAGRDTLDARIRTAARKVCTTNDAGPWRTTKEFQCVMQAVKSGRHATMAAAAAPRTGG